MPKWEISLSPDEVKKIITDHVKAEYGLSGKIDIEAVNDWPYVDIKMGDYPPKAAKSR